jgi:hypothetical protein
MAQMKHIGRALIYMSRDAVMSIDIYQDRATYMKKKIFILYKECVIVYIIKNPQKTDFKNYVQCSFIIQR